MRARLTHLPPQSASRVLWTLLALACLGLAALPVLSGCSGVYYGAMEKIGVHKREILVDRVEEARDSQTHAKQEFTDALEMFRSVVSFNGGELEQRYEALRDTLERVEQRADDVGSRIDSVEDVAEALFDEWERELDQYANPDLQRRSAATLRETREEYRVLARAMRRAEDSMAPVLRTMREQVLFLKHNLNARAISSLQGELDMVQRDVNALVRDMETAINEANRFIDQMVTS